MRNIRNISKRADSYSETLFAALTASDLLRGHGMDERTKAPLEILDSEFWKELEELLASHSLNLEHFHHGTTEFRKTILDEPTYWIEFHMLASPITTS